jgi:hypothetical protein
MDYFFAVKRLFGRLGFFLSRVFSEGKFKQLFNDIVAGLAALFSDLVDRVKDAFRHSDAARFLLVAWWDYRHRFRLLFLFNDNNPMRICKHFFFGYDK